MGVSPTDAKEAAEYAIGVALEAVSQKYKAKDYMAKPPLGEVSKGVQVELGEEYKKKRRRHLVLANALSQDYLLSLLPIIQENFAPQQVVYNGGVEWANSCYMDVEQKMKPATMPHLPLLSACTPVLLECDRLFTEWYTAHHGKGSVRTLTRLQSFVTRYRPQPGENQLARHVDGRNVHGSVILGLPTDDAFTGGGVTVWDGAPQETCEYGIRPGDICMLDRCVWHQGNPIFSGTRWVVVIFYAVLGDSLSRADSRARGVHKVNAASLLESVQWMDKTGAHGMQLQGGDKFEQSKQQVIAHPLDDETRRQLQSTREGETDDGPEAKKAEGAEASRMEGAEVKAGANVKKGEGGRGLGATSENLKVVGGVETDLGGVGGGSSAWVVGAALAFCAVGVGVVFLRPRAAVAQR